MTTIGLLEMSHCRAESASVADSAGFVVDMLRWRASSREQKRGAGNRGITP